MEEVRPRYNTNRNGGNLKISSSSYDLSLPRRHNLKLPMSSHEPNKSWWKDPEMKRKCRVVKYKLYTAEAEFKRSFKARFRRFKYKCIRIIRSF